MYSARSYGDSVKRVTFTGNTVTLSLDNLDRNDIYLVKINKSNSVVTAANTGRALGQNLSIQQNEAPYISTETLNNTSFRELPHRGLATIREFNANPPPFLERTRNYMGPQMQTAFIPPRVGDRRMFWVEDFFDSGRWVQRQATLRATGSHGNVWIMDNVERPISDSQARQMAERFDQVYPLSTNLLGYEFGGGPRGHGGSDGDPKIQILVYDIVDADGNTDISGFFWAKDLYQQLFLDLVGVDIKSNQAEMFYIDAGDFLNAPDFIYSTLIHELQHMINFNVKFIEKGLDSATWYNEMLSMMAEDIIAPLIGVSQSNRFHPVGIRMPFFLESYNRIGATEWIEDSVDQYGVTYAFGAYLMRNYGGPALLEKILANDTTDIESINSALQEVSDVTFEQAFSRFGEAMIFSIPSLPRGALTFDKSVTSTINGRRYTAHGFDIWSISQLRYDTIGPRIFNLNPIDMRPHSVSLHSNEAWIDVSGSISITLERPSNANIDLYLMVR